MGTLSQVGLFVGSAAFSFASYVAGASLSSKWLPKDPDSTQKSLALMGGGTVLGNIGAKIIREYARQNSSLEGLTASCYGTFLGSLLPMCVCIGGFDKKESKTTQMIATACLVSTFCFHMAALMNPEDESLAGFARGLLFGAIPTL